MISNTMLYVGYQGDTQYLIAVVKLLFFALFTGLVWTGVIALRSIAISLQKIVEDRQHE